MLVLLSLLGWAKHGEVSTFEEQALTYRERKKEIWVSYSFNL